MSLRQAILDVLAPQKIEEGEDVFDKFGIQITKTRLKGGIGYQINYGERGRYIQVLKKDMNNLMKAMKTAMDAKQEIKMRDFFEFRKSMLMNEDMAYHQKAIAHHDAYSKSHEIEAKKRIPGMHSAERYNHKTDHNYTHEKHYHAARAHQKAHDAAHKHGTDSSQYKAAAKIAHGGSKDAHSMHPEFESDGKHVRPHPDKNLTIKKTH